MAGRDSTFRMTKTEKINVENGIVLLVKKSILDNMVEVTIQMENFRKCFLHWGLRNSISTSWQIPSVSVWPEGSRAFDHAAAQTPFLEQNGYGQITIRLDRSMDFTLINFALFFPEESRWDNNLGRNYQIEIPKLERSTLSFIETLRKEIKQEKISFDRVYQLAVRPEYEASLGDTELAVLADEIIEKEMSRNSWTLMHRFNLCYDLLDKIKRNNIDGLALIFVWLRFSAIRQLDWQRNYNTKPRELGHAMDRLTLKLASRYINEPGEHGFNRLIMTTIGRGTNAQRVRDEVLNIMHRHNIKEVSGHFMEEWHQKLHNNATPDDIVICEAYLEFLRSNGNLDRFYKRLEEGGVSRKRLESYERPIKSHPDFIPYLKDALIHDFEHFLGILKEVHSGTDLGTAIHTARYLFDAEMHTLMDFIWEHRNDQGIQVYTLIEKITKSRRCLAKRLGEHQNIVRDLLFLDLSLEDFFRVVVERNLHTDLGGDQLVELIAMALENLCLSNDNEELVYCLHHWQRLREMPRFEKEWSLQAKAVLDRLQRAMGSFIDRYYRLLQSKAEFLGRAFHADLWTISLFTEEVVRGRPVFVLSLLLRNLDPILRKSAELGNWQVISMGHQTGMVEVATTLKSFQGKTFARPTIIVADNVAGNEEIPEGVVAIITPAIIDILSHLAVRARNVHILFAICYDPDTIERFKSLSGHSLKLSVNATGDVVFEESSEDINVIPQRIRPVRTISRPSFTAYAISEGDFNKENVGGKSNNLKKIQGRLPKWIGIPTSGALPFWVFEKVLAEENNKELAIHCEELIRKIEEDGKKVGDDVLEELRKTIMTLKAPDELIDSLHNVMEKARLPWPSNWDNTWMCIKRVWASKWNERAYLSRRANRIPHKDLFMAVLIQRVVEADYSFVIHTVNPFTGVKDEIYAEVVLGLGEALVGNYPGRALSFTCRKVEQEPHLLSFPSKSTGLFGSGLIFRSDSNGEDLAGYAGAGLYDSIMLPPPLKVILDYTEDKLIWDVKFRKDFLVTIATIGTIIENILRYPQDIEGAYSSGQYYVVQTRPQVGTGRERYYEKTAKDDHL